jgi:dihydroorotate dehydrogenase electron transfer subunit
VLTFAGGGTVGAWGAGKSKTVSCRGAFVGRECASRHLAVLVAEANAFVADPRATGPMDAPRVVRIEAAIAETSRHATLEFRDPAIRSYEPGQFVMVWVPGVDEVPMALWGGGSEPLRVTVEAKGDCTRVLAAKKAGDRIGIRGPYGLPFRLRGRRVVAVVGGTGTVPLVPFAQRAAKAGAEVRIALGARSKEFLLLLAHFKAAGAHLHVATDDGSEGFHGTSVGLLKRLLDEAPADEVLTCGPERMMRAVVDECVSRNLPVQASLERWMKCAVGICDACLVDGIRLCRDGPVLPKETLVRLQDFGRFEREPSGVRRPLH